jgi:hypothetical protein
VDVGKTEMGEVSGDGGSAGDVGAALSTAITSNKPREIEYLIAVAIHEGMRSIRAGRCNHVSSPLPSPHSKTLIDGDFYLMAVARHVERRLKSGGVIPS